MGYIVYMTNGELYHHGIKGQKWGLRRYQNEDGTLTAAGQKRYGTNLDINDKSRTNIARIRKGEAYRRLDVAKANNETNTTRLAELQGRVRSAQAAEKKMKIVDKGAALAAKGKTVTENNVKSYKAIGAAVLGNTLFRGFMNSRLSTLASEGRLTPNHTAVANVLVNAAHVATMGAAIAYTAKNNSQNRKLRAYSHSKLYGENTIKSVGSSEYADVVKRRQSGESN